MMHDRALEKPPIMRSLLWKDGRSLQSLVLAIWLGILFVNLMVLLLSIWVNFYGDELNLYVCVWMLMPNLVALGAPAMLVGNEEESGTLDWLRTLPVTASKVVDAKFLVASAAVGATWLLASIIVFLVRSGWDVPTGSLPAFAADLLHPLGIAKALLFSFTLLPLGFATAYVIRSPIGALLALVPLIVVVTQVFYLLSGWILSGSLTTEVPRNVALWRQILVVIYALAFLLALWLLQRFFGRRRMTAAKRAQPLIPVADPGVAAYRPPQAVGLQRPGKFAALQWQQMRQAALPLGALTGLCLLLLCVLYVVHPWGGGQVIELIAAFAFPLIILATSWMGALVFYGDSYRRRCVFFADRGISATRVWWTRLLLPAACCLSLAVIAFGLHTESFYVAEPIWAFMLVAFAFGQLTAQWVPRAVLAFFAAPAYMLACSIALFAIYPYYPDYQWTYVLMVPVLLFATWRMTRRWLEGRINPAFHWRMVAYTALAILLPLFVIVADRIVTTPRLRADWRATAMKASDEIKRFDEPRDYRLAVYSHEIMPSARWPIQDSSIQFNFTAYVDLDRQAIAQSLKEELAGDIIGGSIGADDLRTMLQANFRRGDLSGKEFAKLKRNAISVLLKWSRQIRESVLLGTTELYDLERIAEPAETFAVNFLLERADELGDDSEIAALVAAIPGEQLRRQSRIQALLLQWRECQDVSWKHDRGGLTVYRKHFMQHQMAEGVETLALERRRADRFLDEATRLTWNQLERGLPAAQSLGEQQREELWDSILGPRHRRSQSYLYPGYSYSLVGTCWTSDRENAVRRLRTRYPGGQNEE